MVFYEALQTGHFVISSGTAILGQNAYFYGPNWATQNNLSNVNNFNGLVLDPTTGNCGNRFTGIQDHHHNLAHSIGSYISVYVVNSLTQSQLQTISGTVVEIAIIQVTESGTGSVGPNNPGTGTIVDVYCPSTV